MHIRRLQICYGGRDVLAARLAVERLLSSADLRPPGMPPQAVLVVRQVKDPQPGGIAAGLRAVRVRVEWERAVRARLAALYRRAARPARGAVPTGADAVLFDDESELLACLLLDISRGRARERWWWRAVQGTAWSGALPGSPAATAAGLARQLAQRARLVPAVLGHLQRWGQDAWVLHALTPQQAEHVLRTVLHAYRLPDLPGAAATTDAPAPAPWTAARVPPGLGRERSALWGLALDLHPNPHLARAPDYQRRLHAWWRAAEVPPPVEPTQVVQPHAPGLLGQRAATGAVQHTHPNAPGSPGRETSLEDLSGFSKPDRPVRETSPEDLSGFSKPGRSVRETGPEDLPGFSKPGRSVRETGPEDLSGFPKPDRSAGPPRPVRSGLPSQPALAEQPADGLDAWRSGGLSTRLGGVLYLINAMVAFDLPACFEQGWRLASGVGAWGLLEALARELIGAAFPEWQHDPLWAALAQLDGREPGQLPGIRLPRARPRRWPAFRLPDAWLAGLPPEAQAAWRANLDARHTLSQAGYAPLLGRWLALALPFIAYRLRLALDLEPPRGLGPGDDLVEHLLALRGSLYVTSSHLDLVASVDDALLRVRKAGLDRDPGWQPELGRVVYLHFE